MLLNTFICVCNLCIYFFPNVVAYASRPYRTTELPVNDKQINQLQCDSAIALGLLQNPNCSAYYDDQKILIFTQTRTQFHQETCIELNFILVSQIPSAMYYLWAGCQENQ